MPNQTEDIPGPAQNSEGTASRGRPFPRGQSGNPGGRPRLEGEIRKLAQLHAGAALLRIVQLTKSSNPRVALAACLALLERAIGTPPTTPTEADGALTAADHEVFCNRTHDVQEEIDAAARFEKEFKLLR
jgi:hypothetical protein